MLIPLHEAVKVYVLYVEVISPYWRRCLKSFSHNKDKYEGKELS